VAFIMTIGDIPLLVWCYFGNISST